MILTKKKIQKFIYSILRILSMIYIKFLLGQFKILLMIIFFGVVCVSVYCLPEKKVDLEFEG